MTTDKIIRVGVGVIVQNEKGEILLGRRNKTAKRDCTKLIHEWDWSLAGGGVEFGEELETCATREVKEEAMLDIKNPTVFYCATDKNETCHWITVGLKSTAKGTPKSGEPDKYIEWEWFALDNLPDKIFTPSFRVIQSFKQRGTK